MCGKNLDTLFADAHKCRLCGNLVCGRHVKDGVCTYCREKMGKR